jgi:hypothetical protein
MLYINRCGFSQGCAIWGFHRYVSSHGGVILENPSFWGRLKMRISARYTMCSSKNWEMRSFQRSNLEKFVSKANLQPNFKAQPKMSNNFLTVHPRRKTSTDHLWKTDTVDSIGDIRNCLWHHLAAKTISGFNLQVKKWPKTLKRWEIDNKCQRNTNSKSSRATDWWHQICSTTPPSGQNYCRSQFASVKSP